MQLIQDRCELMLSVDLVPHSGHRLSGSIDWEESASA